MISRTLSTLIVRALLIGAVAGAVVLFSPQQLFSGSGLAASGEGRGDNPVVGSLPCAVDDDLDLKFFNWLGQPGPVGMATHYSPTFALVGGQNLETHILDAAGEPNGMINASSAWSALGSVNQMTVTTTRGAALAGAYDAVVWVPDTFLGGTVELASSVGTTTWTLGSNAFALPSRALAMAPGQAVTGIMTVTSPTGAHFQVTLEAVGPIFKLDFQP